jgi:hypothetical protein
VEKKWAGEIRDRFGNRISVASLIFLVLEHSKST